MDKKKSGVRLGVYAVSTLLYMQVVLSILLEAVAEMFPDASVTQVQLSFTISTLTYFISAYIADKMTRVMTKKKVLLIGVAIMLVGGLLPFVLHNSIVDFIIAGALIGFGSGMIDPISVGLILEYFEGEEADKLIGAQEAIMGIAGMALIEAAAILAGVNWMYGYLVYLVTILVFAIVALKVPGDGRIETVDKDSKEKASPFTKEMILVLVLLALFSIFQGTFLNNLAFLVEEQGVGSITLAGSAVSIYVGGSIVAGIILKSLMKKAKKWTLLIACVLMTLGMFLPIISLSSVSMIVAAIFVGFSSALFYVSCLSLVPDLTHKNELAFTPGSTAVAITFNLATFVSAYIVDFISVGTMGDTALARFIVSAIALAATTALAFLFNGQIFKNVEE